eukprot:CAMPEP_0198322280 /NCGR_PEP_ID=MMETSP1450-20131203/10796_1 /TAXON_ID=753684 ORGANISM="Madagascaria erythrocladiodes, Strain CCMP3234" /NCGR_SAMPLE_ID=MMETSP1450 /ASSEMBLY_ACC=CAM_ASM_001115 /LENGTH=257 /DNA_ID=CAMNT_0044025889 /DNA_START=135 /DNA_END=908 /DNA_ORIENTATION=+
MGVAALPDDPVKPTQNPYTPTPAAYPQLPPPPAHGTDLADPVTPPPPGPPQAALPPPTAYPPPVAYLPPTAYPPPVAYPPQVPYPPQTAPHPGAQPANPAPIPLPAGYPQPAYPAYPHSPHSYPPAVPHAQGYYGGGAIGASPPGVPAAYPYEDVPPMAMSGPNVGGDGAVVVPLSSPHVSSAGKPTEGRALLFFVLGLFFGLCFGLLALIGLCFISALHPNSKARKRYILGVAAGLVIQVAAFVFVFYTGLLFTSS